jgi:asparagine synthase (glutamine-hydrolysing)
LVERPKAGFAVPIAFWLRHELRNWAQDLITELRRIEPDVFDWLEVEKRWREFLSGCDYWSIHLWMLTIYASWRVDHYRLAKII